MSLRPHPEKRNTPSQILNKGIDLKRISLLILLLSFNCFAQSSYKIMTFNTMCDFCGSDKYPEYEQRIKYIKQTVEKYKADLISLQEIRTQSQALQIFTLPDYELIMTDTIAFSYADPLLAINKTKFEILEKGQFWLGPDDNLIWGWKFALPRQVHWVKIKDKKTNKELYFIGSHFDNRPENLDGSIQKIVKFVKTLNAPFIFAADTNIQEHSKRYDELSAEEFINTFDLVTSYKVQAQQSYLEKELCYKQNEKGFPGCRVDHILLSKQNDWKVLNWIIDLSKFGEKNLFTSDHRAIISEVILN